MSYRVAFFGTPDFSVPALKSLIRDNRFKVALVVTQPDRAVGRGQKLSRSPVKQVAIDNDIAVFQPNSLKQELDASLKYLHELDEVDIGVVVAFGQILPEAVLNWPKMGCINIHASLLPRWRGAAPIQRAIMAGDTKTGVCLMRMEKGLDSGAVYCVAETAIETTDNFATLHDRLADLGAELLTANLDKIITNEILAVEQNSAGITYAHKLEESEQLIDWSKPAVEIAAKIRAFAPTPAAYTLLDGVRLKIFQVRIHSSSIDGSTTPGAVIRCDRNQFLVNTGLGVLELEELQLAGKKRLSARDFFNGSQVRTETILGR